jgi:hypothetical protein
VLCSVKSRLRRKAASLVKKRAAKKCTDQLAWLVYGLCRKTRHFPQSHLPSHNRACTRPNRWLKSVAPCWNCKKQHGKGLLGVVRGTIFVCGVASAPTRVAILIPLPRRAIDHQSAPYCPVHCDRVAPSFRDWKKQPTLSHTTFDPLQKVLSKSKNSAP